MVPAPDKRALIDKKSTNRIKSFFWIFYYYDGLVDPTMLQAINEIFMVKYKLTKETNPKAYMLLDVSATYPNAFIQYHNSDMAPHVDFDAEYIKMTEAQSFFVGNCISVIDLHWIW